jgi:hypothetical protein
MLSIKGVYDGHKVHLSESIKDNKKYKVIVTFVEELKEDEVFELREFGIHADAALDFWNDPAEDLYQDYLKAK